MISIGLQVFFTNINRDIKRRRRSAAVWRLSRGSDGFALDESLGFSHVRASMAPAHTMRYYADSKGTKDFVK
jgi:hypothetical protein